MNAGRVKWFDEKRGYGFIEPEPEQGKGTDVFVHFTTIEGSGFKTLQQGERVQFECAQGQKGLQATRVARAQGA